MIADLSELLEGCSRQGGDQSAEKKIRYELEALLGVRQFAGDHLVDERSGEEDDVGPVVIGGDVKVEVFPQALEHVHERCGIGLLDILGSLAQELQECVGHPEPEIEQGFDTFIDEEPEQFQPVFLAYLNRLIHCQVLGIFHRRKRRNGLLMQPDIACTEEIVLRFEMTVDECFGASCYLGEILGRETLLPAFSVGFDGRV